MFGSKSQTKDQSEAIEKIVSFCKRRGFVFPSSEIYGGFAAIYDYGHYGVLLKNNIRDAWWRHTVQLRDDVVGLDSAIFMHPTTWKASGHVDSFDDPQIDCRKCKSRMRADQILELFGVSADKAPLDFINVELEKLRELGKLTCQSCGSTDITPAKRFSLMVKSNLGSPTEELSEKNVVYLRPETCGGIYLEYKNTLDSTRVRLPFGIAQVGKAFRNEVIARQFIFRTREFEQMEMQYFLNPKDMKEKYEMWKDARWKWYLEYGLGKDDLKWHKHEKLAHYASEAYDIEYNFKSLGGFKEVEGIHARGNWDLSRHSEFSGVDLSYFDEETKERFIPHIMETSAGLNRMFLMFLDKAYNEEEVDGEKRVVLKLDKRLSPVKVAVFPLLKNRPELVEKARNIFEDLRKNFMCEFDDNGNVGKRYRRQDEIGTPYCVTVDFQSLEDDSVTVRDRDTMKQKRITIKEIADFVKKGLN
ncbi:glycine--tRNA ligase [Candidatus Azambacteria bacterium RIFCSPHIGHO2_01_FULL_44_55]|uniref:Glycine--tRNA ligase n=1 Tax=Candidatus Azambacteria bacterium RIFCSPLOWO2_02_FULL_44_14 TaxID=1797306 RepID=A0A1F5CAA4_9BACT|nr:MAG: glycine--tRNA ligase [Candidatus Azambacteria bacterium RIFCSPLOWO2_01_FULL_44_84]OGD32820.1 MAG: glycine--tRNA ligase [Candidatus Azambacteria bacterium RIFCSPHIGHO2_02_FULL_45_18]OGD39786.1 MAG: glycine--tRNA ligase [Candidatus Azambacteria bacterium RIFCSPLOWO2_02_FULL_44_14]OGD40479.1 MAG: glycine--tRNA ligase [Candidatus Azambacteria bacterium RIFCSPHIGHO2_01_FULL_44_55]OGD52118.1 MAG: glycine--tRNA ligase [Candidatus Azambacteria bacterium RIFOXYD1_FULL_44_10]